MNKFLKILILVVLAIIVVFCIDKFSGIGEDSEREGTDSTRIRNPIEQALINKIDSLFKTKWNKVNFENLKEEIESYKEQKVISEAEINSYDSSLNVYYAKTIEIAFEKWINNNCESNCDALQKEMGIISTKYNECKIILANTIETLNKYKGALNIPSKVNKYLTQEYSETVQTNINNEIINLCNDRTFSNCDRIQQIYSEQIKKMSDFEEYAKAFKAAEDIALEDDGNVNNDYEYYKDLVALCPSINSETQKYGFYYSKMLDYNLRQKICSW